MQIKNLASATCDCGERKINHQFSVGPHRWFCYCSNCYKRMMETSASRRRALIKWNRHHHIFYGDFNKLEATIIKPKTISIRGDIW